MDWLAQLSDAPYASQPRARWWRLWVLRAALEVLAGGGEAAWLPIAVLRNHLPDTGCLRSRSLGWQPVPRVDSGYGSAPGTGCPLATVPSSPRGRGPGRWRGGLPGGPVSAAGGITGSLSFTETLIQRDCPSLIHSLPCRSLHSKTCMRASSNDVRCGVLFVNTVSECIIRRRVTGLLTP